MTLLHLACESGHSQTVDYLLGLGANPNTPAGGSYLNWTSLFFAAKGE